ncbi:MAG: hypothetical protein H0X63_10265 [Flavobacteriales bacterium]|nr:hypothetical protein [Flavobacteriales bacterium]
MKKQKIEGYFIRLRQIGQAALSSVEWFHPDSSSRGLQANYHTKGHFKYITINFNNPKTKQL